MGLACVAAGLGAVGADVVHERGAEIVAVGVRAVSSDFTRLPIRSRSRPLAARDRRRWVALADPPAAVGSEHVGELGIVFAARSLAVGTDVVHEHSAEEGTVRIWAVAPNFANGAVRSVFHTLAAVDCCGGVALATPLGASVAEVVLEVRVVLCTPSRLDCHWTRTHNNPHM